MARQADLLSSEKGEKPCIPWVNACVFLWGTPQNGWFPCGFALSQPPKWIYTLQRKTDPNGKLWDPHDVLKPHIYIYRERERANG